ncbi:MAG: hypothetical protein H6Q89_4298 [Myxococcaceae bacterium]|nr:hypothetical protein [Myxococcaceae bacterium]
MTSPPNVFRNEHKGIRSALFDLCLQIGRTDSSQQDKWEAVLQRTREVMGFVDRHRHNEDSLLLPLLKERAPEYYQRMRTAHRELDATHEALTHALENDPPQLYHSACDYTAALLEHMREEELEHLPVLQIHLSASELEDFQRRALMNAAPPEQNLLLRSMLGAMTDSEVAEFLVWASTAAPTETQAQFRAVALAVRQGP